MNKENKYSDIFSRQKQLIGESTMDIFAETSVAVFGVGGVGSWCAESLVRSGIGKITLIDFDKVALSNINRQLHATVKTVDMFKVDVLEKRFLSINPDVEIAAVNCKYGDISADRVDLKSFGYIIDAIDTLDDKVELIKNSLKSGTTIFSSSGAAGKLDPLRIKIDSVWNVKGCPLGKLVRKRLRALGITGDFLSVYSDELLETYSVGKSGEFKTAMRGTAAHITALFGFNLAGLVFNDIVKKSGIKFRERGIDYSFR